MNHNLSQQCKVVHLSADVTAGTDGSRQALTEIDTQGYDSVMVVASLGTVTADGIFTLRAKGSNTTSSYGSGTIGDLASVATEASGGGSKGVVLEIARPLNRYMRFDYQRTGANVVINSIVAILLKNTDVEASELGARKAVVSPKMSST